MVPHGKLDACIDLLEEGMRALRSTPYYEVVGRDYLHHTAAAAEYLVAFFRKASVSIRVAAIYFEMNGFSINPDRWYFDGFAYQAAGDLWDLDWLSQWDADTDNNSFTLTGLESVQLAFARLLCDETQPLSVKMAAELAEHLVNARFMQLISAAHAQAKQLCQALDGVPVLATAHDWDTVHQTR
jgi:hypothetical protein